MRRPGSLKPLGDGGLGFGEALGVFVFEVFHDGLLEAGVEPVEVLYLTAFVEDAALLGLGAEGLDEFPDGVDAVFMEGGTGGGAGFPSGGEGLPLQLFKDEWKGLGEGKNPEKYLPFTHTEINVPWILAALYGILFLWSTLETFCTK